MQKTVAIIGALDTKGEDIRFIRRMLLQLGRQVLLIDTSIMGRATQHADVDAREITAAAGAKLSALRKMADRGAAIAALCSGIPLITQKLVQTRKIHGVIGIGGGAGTSVGTAAMRALPVGFPKIMISTMASGVTRSYVGEKDIKMFPSIVDIAGVNAVSSRIYTNAVGAMHGMLDMVSVPNRKRKTIALSMFGNTTPVVERCKNKLQQLGYETLIFHANGVGGQSMESMILEGLVDGVLDITTTELADELVGGDASAGPRRLEAAGRQGVPQIIVPGCLDMVNFFTATGRLSRFAGRKIVSWNPEVSLLRTTPAENRQLGELIAQKVNAATGRTTIVLPLRGVSMLDAPGKAFAWPAANRALFVALRSHVASHIPVIEVDAHINDAHFADRLVRELLKTTTHRGESICPS